MRFELVREAAHRRIATRNRAGDVVRLPAGAVQEPLRAANDKRNPRTREETGSQQFRQLRHALAVAFGFIEYYEYALGWLRNEYA